MSNSLNNKEKFEIKVNKSLQVQIFLTSSKKEKLTEDKSFSMIRSRGEYPKEVGLIEASKIANSRDDYIMFHCDEFSQSCVCSNPIQKIAKVDYSVYDFFCGKENKIENFIVSNIPPQVPKQTNYLFTTFIIILSLIIILFLMFILYRTCKRLPKFKKGIELKDKYGDNLLEEKDLSFFI